MNILNSLDNIRATVVFEAGEGMGVVEDVWNFGNREAELLRSAAFLENKGHFLFRVMVVFFLIFSWPCGLVDYLSWCHTLLKNRTFLGARNVRFPQGFIDRTAGCSTVKHLHSTGPKCRILGRDLISKGQRSVQKRVCVIPQDLKGRIRVLRRNSVVKVSHLGRGTVDYFRPWGLCCEDGRK